MSQEQTPTKSQLLDHRQFVERLAARLAKDSETAADLAQETWLRALANPPRHGTNLRAWLRRIAHNVLYKSSQRSRQTTQLDSESSWPGDTASTILERRELLDLIVAEVIRLDEPYQSVVSLRFFDELSPPEIAERLQRPLTTVSNQLHRGLERLRQRLDRAYAGERRTWTALVLPLWSAPRSETRAPALRTLENVGAGWRLLIAGGSLVGLLMVWGLLAGTPSAQVDFRDSRSAALLGSASSDEFTRTTQLTSLESRLQRTSLDTAELVGEEESQERRLQVTVLDDFGHPLANAEVSAVAEDPEGRLSASDEYGERVGQTSVFSGRKLRTDAAGQVTLDLDEKHRIRFEQFDPHVDYVAVSVLAEGHVASLLNCVPFPDESLTQLAVRLESGAQTVTLRLQDSEGVPVQAYAWMNRKTPTAPHSDVRLIANPRKTQSNAEGVWVHPNTPPGRHVFEVDAPGYRHARLVLDVSDSAGSIEHVVVLERGVGLHGRAFGNDGSPLPGARIWAEIGHGNKRRTPTTYADEFGYFHLDSLPETRAWVYAVDANDPQLLAMESFEFQSGESQLWHPVLRRVEGLGLKVENESGNPIPGITLYAYLPARRDRAPWNRVLDPDDAGRTRVLDCPDDDLVVEAFLSKDDLYQAQLPDWTFRELRRTPDEQTLVIPMSRLERGSMSGVLFGSNGDPVQGAQVYVRGRGRSLFKPVSLTSALGEFREERLPPGEFEFLAGLPGSGMTSLGMLEMVEAETLWREFEFPPTYRLSVDWGWPAESPPLTYEVIHQCDLGDTVLSFPAIRGYATDPPTSFELLEGSYTCRVRRGTQLLAERRLEVTSQAGQHLVLAPGD